MNDDGIIQKIKVWIHNNGDTFSKMVSLAFLVFGILVVIGAIKNWDWLYKPDDSYHNKWTIGQLSRYLGRRPARIAGFFGGLLLIAVGSFWSYRAFLKN